MPFFRRSIARNPIAPAPAPAAPAAQPPSGSRIFGQNRAPAAVTPAAAPQANLSTAIGQLKAGDQFGGQNTMRQMVGLPTITPPPANANPQLSDAIGRFKMGDKASGMAMMRKIVGLKKGGSVKSSASKRADGIAQKGKTKGRMV